MSNETCDSPSLNPHRLGSYLSIRLLDELYDGRTLTKVLFRKLLRRFTAQKAAFEPVVFYNGLVVFDRPGLHGGGLSWGQDFSRVLLELGFRRCQRIFEYCAGPGYIGFSLLSNGFCEKLTLADINPCAIDAVRHTVAFNHIEDRVNVYTSDGLKDIPREERWDLVVSNPPHFLPRDTSDTDIRAYDPDWEAHRQFYANARGFMKPLGRVVMMENLEGSNVADFEPMIREGGGRVAATLMGRNLAGAENELYYIVDEW